MFGSRFDMPPVVKNLIILNALFFVALLIFDASFNTDLNTILGLYFPASAKFSPFQIVSHMFMHGGLTHIFFNMFALYMFGKTLEMVWGPKRFLLYYIVTGLGAATIHTLVNYLHFVALKNDMSPDSFQMVMERGAEIWSQRKNFIDPGMAKMNEILNIPTVGASGAVFGILLAFGMLFPNTQIMLLIPPIPIRAKYFVMIYGGLELYLGITQPGSSIAHFAHLGGMIFGFFLIRYWRKNSNTFY